MPRKPPQPTVAALKRQRDLLQKKYVERGEAIKRLHHDIALLQERIDRGDTRIAELTARVDIRDRELAQKTETITSLNVKLMDAQAHLALRNGEIDRFEDSLAVAKKETAAAQSQLEYERDVNSTLYTQRNELRRILIDALQK